MLPRVHCVECSGQVFCIQNYFCRSWVTKAWMLQATQIVVHLWMFQGTMTMSSEHGTVLYFFKPPWLGWLHLLHLVSIISQLYQYSTEIEQNIGLYNAMQATGAGGQQTPYLVM